MNKHIKNVAVLLICLSIFRLLLAIIFNLAFSLIGDFAEGLGETILTNIADIVATFMIVTSIPGIIAGFGLFKFKGWARILAIIIAAISLLSFPLGTAFGIYTLWVLLNKESIDLFQNS